MKHHTKDKGDIGVGFVIADLMSKHISVCIPISEHLPFDLVGVREDGTLLRISVKYRTISNGTINVALKSVYSDSKGSHKKKIDKNLIDIIAIYCPDNFKIYYVNPKKFKEDIRLRILPTKNNQSKHIIFADDYLTL